jgi:putative transposase
MKKSRFSEAQIIAMLQQYESGIKVTDICREKGITTATFYNWKRKYEGMDARQLKELKSLQEENRRLKQMYADLSLDHLILKNIIEKKL